eukprot:290016-Pleurochrysis_carterae.AAC.1
MHESPPSFSAALLPPARDPTRIYLSIMLFGRITARIGWSLDLSPRRARLSHPHECASQS